MAVPRSLCRFVSQVCRKLTRLGALALLPAAEALLVVLAAPALLELPPRSPTSFEKARSNRFTARSRCRVCGLSWVAGSALVPAIGEVVPPVIAAALAAAVESGAVLLGPVAMLVLGPCAFSC